MADNKTTLLLKEILRNIQDLQNKVNDLERDSETTRDEVRQVRREVSKLQQPLANGDRFTKREKYAIMIGVCGLFLGNLGALSNTAKWISAILAALAG